MKASEIAEKMFEMEKELNIFKKQIQGVCFWKLVRLDVYQQILNKYNLISVNKKPKLNILEKIRKILRIVKNSYYYPLYGKRVDSIIIENPRKILGEDNKYYDPYTKHLVGEMERKNLDYEIIDPGMNGLHYEKASTKRRFIDNFYYDFLCRFFMQRVKINNMEKRYLEEIENKLNSIFDININLTSIVLNEIYFFNLTYMKYYLLFKKKQNKKLYLVCSYGKEGIIKAAKDLNIKVIELQHGTITRFHMGYSFPHNSEVPYFPDEIFLFGKFWSDSTPLPLPKKALSVLGHRDFNKNIKSIKGIKKKKKITFISQWTVGQLMIVKALEVAKYYPDYKIIYRLHPNEYKNKQSYLDRISEKNLKNLELGCIRKTILKEIADSEFVVGVYSTAIYEALALKCKILLLPFYGVDYMKYLIDNNYAYVANLDSIIDLDKINLEAVDSDYFFAGLNS